MARFNTLLTNSGAILLTQALANSEIVNINKATMGNGIYEGDKNQVRELVSPVEVNTKMGDREFIQGVEGKHSILKISLQTLNNGLTEPVAIREIGLFADDILFAYAWIDGEDTDNILPTPLDLNEADTIHMHELALFVTNQENASIEVSFAFDGFVSHGYLNQRLESLEVVEELTKDIEGHIDDKSIHFSEEERKVFDEIIKDYEDNPSTGNNRDVIRVSMQTGFTYSLNSLDRYTNKVLIPMTFNTRTSIPKVSIIGDFSIQTSTGLIDLESLEVKSISYNYVVLEGALKSNYPLNSPVVLLSSDNSEIKIESPSLSGVDVEEITATEDNQVTAFIGFTHNIDDKDINEYGEVDRVLITLPFNTRDTVPNISIIGDFSVQTGNSSIKLSDLQVKEVTKSYTLLEGMLEEAYPINSPVALIFDSVASKIVIKD